LVAGKPFLQELCKVFLPITTTFDAAGAMDRQGLLANIEGWQKSSLGGYVLLGSTGERVHLTDRECLDVIETARETVPESMAFIVGAGQQSTRVTIDEVRRYATAGADAVLVITPCFYKSAMTQDALYKYYMAVADASPVSVILYSMPALTGIAITPETVARLSEHSNIIGLKDSSNNMENLAETIRLVHDDFAMLTGNGPSLYAALRAGAKGGILAVGCVAPNLCVAIYDAVMAGEFEKAEALQNNLTPLANAVTVKYGIGGLKAALDMIGLYGGPVRAPLEDASEEARQDIARLLEAAGVIGDNVASD
jgi:4-hydroxy-2-oxoglutarate aldolase